MSENLDILDQQIALKAVSGNQQLADDLLQMFIKELPNYKQNIQLAFEQQDMDALKAVIHKVHGGLRYLGAPALMDVVRQTDNELFNLNYHALSQALDRIYLEIDRVLELGSYQEPF